MTTDLGAKGGTGTGDTGTNTVAALTAEVAMLREHIARGAAAREARRSRPKHANRPGAVTQWHDAGREAAWREVLEIMTAVTEHPAATAGTVMEAVMAMGRAFCDLRDSDTFPADWSGQ